MSWSKIGVYIYFSSTTFNSKSFLSFWFHSSWLSAPHIMSHYYSMLCSIISTINLLFNSNLILHYTVSLLNHLIFPYFPLTSYVITILPISHLHAPRPACRTTSASTICCWSPAGPPRACRRRGCRGPFWGQVRQIRALPLMDHLIKAPRRLGSLLLDVSGLLVSEAFQSLLGARDLTVSVFLSAKQVSNKCHTSVIKVSDKWHESVI